MRLGQRHLGILSASLLALAVGSGAAQPARAGSRSDESEAQRYFRLGQVQYGQGKTQQAIESIEKSIKLDSGNAEAHNYLGVIHLDQTDLKGAEKQFREAVRLNPYYTDAHNNLGVAYKEQKKYDKALKEFEIALRDKAYGTPEKIHLNMGHLYLDRGQYPEAIGSFEKAVAANAKYLRGLVGLGLAYQKSGRPDQARQEFQKVVRLDPDSPEAAQARTYLDGQGKRDAP